MEREQQKSVKISGFWCQDWINNVSTIDNKHKDIHIWKGIEFRFGNGNPTLGIQYRDLEIQDRNEITNIGSGVINMAVKISRRECKYLGIRRERQKECVNTNFWKKALFKHRKKNDEKTKENGVMKV